MIPRRPFDDSGSSRLAFAVASRPTGEIVRPALTFRIIALAVVLTVLVQLEWPIAITLCLPAIAMCMLRARSIPPPGATPEPSARVASAATKRSPAARHRRWVLVTWWDVLSALLVIALAAWGTVPLPVTSRFLALSAAAILLTVVSARICLDPRWYRPQGRPRRLARSLRALAGPLGLIAILAIAIPAPWGAGERTVVAVIALLPMACVALIQDQEMTVQSAVEMIRTEAQDGRQAVLDELHGTLSANLRLLEQASLELRNASPRLYELAVSANSRLRETLTLADPQLDSVAQPQTLGALVRTLTMAVGARGELTIALDRLADTDRDLVRLVLNDAIRVVLADGASRVSAVVGLADGAVVVTVTGGGSGDRDRLPRLAPLRRRLAAVGGSIAEERVRSADPQLALVARWPSSPGTA